MNRYIKFLRMMMRDERFLANIRHPEAGWKISRSEVERFIGKDASIRSLAHQARLMGLSVRWSSAKCIIIKPNPGEALLELIGEDGYYMGIRAIKTFEKNTGLDAIRLLESMGYEASLVDYKTPFGTVTRIIRIVKKRRGFEVF